MFSTRRADGIFDFMKAFIWISWDVDRTASRVCSFLSWAFSKSSMSISSSWSSSVKLESGLGRKCGPLSCCDDGGVELLLALIYHNVY